MTDPEPTRRATDRLHPRLLALHRWWENWGQLLSGIWLIIVSIVLASAVIIYAVDSHDSAIALKASCIRTKKFGPALAVAYAKYHILTAEQLVEYRKTIPTKCP